MTTVPCPHCEAPIKPTATFCLACDTPVVDTERGLSVAETELVQVGRPLIGLVVSALALLAVGGAAYGLTALYRHGQATATSQATSAVSRGVRLLVSAESGRDAACRDLREVSALQPTSTDPAATLLARCRSLLGRDPSAHVTDVEVDRTHVSPQAATGSTRVRATITDRSGSHDLDRTVDVVRRGRTWVMSWDGRPLV